ncbi:MAG TPA: 2-amino-4-hydroxy-6-hydroxymethyldihydropteridine diphosphokinase [Candidatus Eisenbacteria bacterium]|jgi:2-amino-4-hydroxy-6-hydroxymethyldihydropteridine diphosphokinase|nr:2-amino-4-hydroxy-6-hydroxymethyldihydropteridine diphosphokinase [Candidatus Eisenbacteria bacterium]
MQNEEFGLLAFIALGSNLGDSRGLIRRAMEELQKFSAQPLLKSSLWKTTPVDCPPNSPSFLNAAAGLVPRERDTPESLLQGLQAMEKEMGRTPKTILNEPRPLDLDLITFGSEIRVTADLTLPHPRAHLRRFVLQPLNEIAPDLILPGQTKTVAQLLASLRNEEVVIRVD